MMVTMIMLMMIVIVSHESNSNNLGGSIRSVCVACLWDVGQLCFMQYV